jgi:hypothetical protein
MICGQAKKVRNYFDHTSHTRNTSHLLREDHLHLVYMKRVRGADCIDPHASDNSCCTNTRDIKRIFPYTCSQILTERLQIDDLLPGCNGIWICK